MPNKKIAEMIQTRKQAAPAIPLKTIPLPDSSSVIPESPLVAMFENKAGHYELTRVENNQAYYSFTNLHGRTVDAIMSATMWRRMQGRADAGLQETA
jgi:hypothetical protein